MAASCNGVQKKADGERTGSGGVGGKVVSNNNNTMVKGRKIGGMRASTGCSNGSGGAAMRSYGQVAGGSSGGRSGGEVVVGVEVVGLTGGRRKSDENVGGVGGRRRGNRGVDLAGDDQVRCDDDVADIKIMTASTSRWWQHRLQYKCWRQSGWGNRPGEWQSGGQGR